jgi:hypothetical protein
MKGRKEERKMERGREGKSKKARDMFRNFVVVHLNSVLSV